MLELGVVAEHMHLYVTRIRSALHEIPELRFEEVRTLMLIKAEIARFTETYGAPLEVRELNGGLVVDFTIDPTMDRLLFRADIDGLPVTEATGLPCASKHPKTMHACGHDTHAAMLLGALRVIAKGAVQPIHNLRFVFQRAEENPITESGGAMLVREGVCDGIAAAYALHINPDEPAGTFLSRPGRMLGNSDRVKITLACSGGHVAQPHLGTNAIEIGIEIYRALQALPLRTLGPFEPVSLVPAQFNAGMASNVLPGQAVLWFAARNMLSPDAREKFHEAIRAEVTSVVSRYPGATVEVEVIKGHPILTNTPTEVERIGALLASHGQAVAKAEPELGGEDFAHYLYAVPGCMWMLGAHQEGTGTFHTPTFNPDPSVFWRGVLYWLALATH